MSQNADHNRITLSTPQKKARICKDRFANQLLTVLEESPAQKEVEMRSSNIGDKLAIQQVKEGPAKEAWIKEQMKFEIDRLKAVLRDGLATDEEKSIAQSQIANYQEMAAVTIRPLPGWLQQMDLLADPDDDRHPMMVEHCVVADDDSSSVAPSELMVRTAWR